MPETVLDSITRLLRYQRAPEKATMLFRGWKHNSDLLPRLQIQLEVVLDTYDKFEPIVYDTQGPRDDGSDVVLRYAPEGDKTDRELLSFQVKSFDDLSKKTCMQDLKAQRDDSFRKVAGMRRYFVVLCTDGKAHKDKIRNIMAEFRSADRTEVIEPAFAYTFLHHPKTRVEALVKRGMVSGDFVFRLAMESLDLPSPSARALAVFMTVKSVLTGLSHFTIDQLREDSILRAIYGELREQHEKELWSGNEESFELDEFDEQLAKDISLLESGFLELKTGSEDVLLVTDRLRALNAVVTDALARYEYGEIEIMAYMFTLMGVKD